MRSKGDRYCGGGLEGRGPNIVSWMQTMGGRCSCRIPSNSGLLARNPPMFHCSMYGERVASVISKNIDLISSSMSDTAARAGTAVTAGAVSWFRNIWVLIMMTSGDGGRDVVGCWW